MLRKVITSGLLDDALNELINDLVIGGASLPYLEHEPIF